MITLETLIGFIKSRSQVTLVVISVSTSVALLLVLVYLADIGKIIDNIILFRQKWYLAVFVVFILLLCTAALRLHLSLRLSGRHNYMLAIDTTLLHTILLSVLPARLGDLCYPFILKSNFNIIAAKSLVNLFVIRVYDYVCVVVLLSLSSLFFILRTNESLEFRKYIAVAILAFILAVYLIRLFTKLAVEHIRPGQFNIMKKDIHEFFSELDTGFSELTYRDHAFLLVTTILRWLLASMLFYSIFQGMDVNLGIIDSILITTGISMSVIIPIQTIGGFGLAEAILAYFLGIFGYPLENAIEISIATRIIWLVIPFILGAIWLLVRKSLLDTVGHF